MKSHNHTSSPAKTPVASTHNHSSATLPNAFALFAPSWEALKLNLLSFVLGAVVPLLLLIAPLIILFTRVFTVDNSGLVSVNIDSGTGSSVFNIVAIIAGTLAVMVIVLLFQPYMYLLKLQSAKGVKVGFQQNLKQALPLVWRVFGLTICRGLLIFVGFILLVIPGFIMWRRYMLAPYYLVDQDMGIVEALKKSAAHSKPAGALYGMMVVYILLDVVGIIPLIGAYVGGILSIVYCCAQAVRYLQMKKA